MDFKNLISFRSLLALFACLLFISGCDNDHATLRCFITNVTGTYTDYEYSSMFSYAADNKVTSVVVRYTEIGHTDITTYAVTYNSSGNISKADGSDGSRTEFSYDADDRVSRQDFYEGTALADRTEYEYNSSGQLIKLQFYEISISGEATKGFYLTYEYADTSTKNPFRSKSFSTSGNPNGSAEFQYDDKRTPYAEQGIPLQDSETAGAINNVTKRTSKSNSGTIENTKTCVYQYNENGYPVQMTQTLAVPGSSTTYNSTETYTYECK